MARDDARNDGPVLGEDITDIESLGGWETALSRLLGSEASSMAVIRFLEDRRGTSGGTYVDDETARLIYACWWSEPRLMVQPPFPQLGRHVYRPADSSGVEVDEFTDIVVEQRRLRRGSTALGWQNGNVDGFEGYLYDVIKPNPIAGLTAVLALRTGISIRHYDDDAEVKLGSLTFVPFGQPDDRTAPMSLAEVPTVMLSETVAEVRILTVDGVPN